MKNQVVKYKKEEAQIVTLAQAKVLTKGKTVVNVGTKAWNTTTTKQTTQTNVLDLNDSSQVKKFVAYFSEVTGLTAIKEEQQELRKAMENRDKSIDARLDQQAQDVQTLIETTKQNTKAIQDNDHSYKQAIETIASSQKAIMEYFAQAAKSTQHDNTTITTQASTDISQLTPDPKSHGANDQAAGTHDNSEMTRGEET
jgi:ABC-type molybdate transport system ATPase subunit